MKLLAAIALAAGALVADRDPCPRPAPRTAGVASPLADWCRIIAHVARAAARRRCGATTKGGRRSTASRPARPTSRRSTSTSPTSPPPASPMPRTTSTPSRPSTRASSTTRRSRGSHRRREPVSRRRRPAATPRRGQGHVLRHRPASCRRRSGRSSAANNWPMDVARRPSTSSSRRRMSASASTRAPRTAANPCTTNVFCAYHSRVERVHLRRRARCRGRPGRLLRSRRQAPAGNGADATINTISHEQNEAITDPFPAGGWISDDSAHNIPRSATCAPTTSACRSARPGRSTTRPSTATTTTSSSSTATRPIPTGGCVPYLGGPVTRRRSAQDGARPARLPGRHRHVMTTNTVYAIYWVPAAPANNEPAEDLRHHEGREDAQGSRTAHGRTAEVHVPVAPLLVGGTTRARASRRRPPPRTRS